MRFHVCELEALTKRQGTSFNAEVTRNPHRWKNSLDEKKVTILEELATELQFTWVADSETPKSYPMVTNDLFAETKRKLAGYTPPKKKTTTMLPARRRAKTFADLFDETTIRIVYENEYSDGYDEALKVVSSGTRGWGKALHKLLKAAETSYTIAIGSEIPAPKIHFLHRQLLDIGEAVGLGDLTNPGLQEFFEDLCPCGRKHNAESLRKLRKRVEKRN